MRDQPQPHDDSGPDQFEIWRDTLARLAMPVDVRSSHVAEFTGSIKATRIGDVTMVQTINKPVSTHRTASLIRQSDPEAYFLLLNLSPAQYVSVGRSDVLLHAGDMVVLHSSMTFNAGTTATIPRQHGGLVLCEPSALQIANADLARIVGRRLPGDDAVGGLVSRYLHHLATRGCGMDEVDAVRLSKVTLDLLSVMISRQLRIVAKLPSERRERERLAQIQSFILARLRDPGLDPETIAAAHHVSLRTLHRLFEVNTDTTVAQWIRERRLEGLRADLLDPMLAERPVISIARTWGFTDASYITRAFKNTYGMSPGAYREQRDRES